MKTLIIILILLGLSSCEDTTGKLLKPDPTPKDSAALFDVTVGKIWAFENVNNRSDQATLRVFNKDSSEWALQFYDTAKRITLQSYFLEFKEFDKGFPRYTDFGIAKIGDSLLFGTRSHSLVAPDYPTDFFVKLFTIPANPSNGIVEFDSTGRIVLDVLRYWKSRAVWTETTAVSPLDTIRRPAWLVSYSAEQKTPVVAITGDEYVFIKDIGFYKIKNFVLIDYTKQ